MFVTGRHIREKEIFKIAIYQITVKSNASTSAFAVVANGNGNET
jgi:hypothetical protein